MEQGRNVRNKLSIEHLFSSHKWKSLKKEQWFVIMLCGVLLLLLAIPFPQNKDVIEVLPVSVEEVVPVEINYGDEWAYAQNLEKKLEVILATMDMVGEVKVLITLSSSIEKVVEKDTQTMRDSIIEEDAQGGSRESISADLYANTIYQSEGGNQEPYVIKIIQPEIEGVMVVAEGAGNGSVNKNITEAIQALFSIEAHKIKVVKMKQS